MADGVVELPSGRFRWRVQVASRRITGTADTLMEAVRDRAQASIEAGGAAPRNITVRELVGIWLTDVDHAETTAARRDEALDAVPDEFMDREASLVTPVVARALWKQMGATGVGAHTILKASHALSSSYRHGVALELVPTNPIAAVRPKVPPSKRIAPPAREDVRRLLEQVKRRPDLHAWVRFMAVTGARPGEVCGLQWGDLDDTRKVVRVSRSITRQRSETPGKNGERGHRDVPVDPQTFAALRRVERIVGCPWVFTHDGRTPWRPDGATLEVRRALDKLNLKMRPTTSATSPPPRLSRRAGQCTRSLRCSATTPPRCCACTPTRSRLSPYPPRPSPRRWTRSRLHREALPFSSRSISRPR